MNEIEENNPHLMNGELLDWLLDIVESPAGRFKLQILMEVSGWHVKVGDAASCFGSTFAEAAMLALLRSKSHD